MQSNIVTIKILGRAVAGQTSLYLILKVYMANGDNAFIKKRYNCKLLIQGIGRGQCPWAAMINGE